MGSRVELDYEERRLQNIQANHQCVPKSCAGGAPPMPSKAEGLCSCCMVQAYAGAWPPGGVLQQHSTGAREKRAARSTSRATAETAPKGRCSGFSCCRSAPAPIAALPAEALGRSWPRLVLLLLLLLLLPMLDR